MRRPAAALVIVILVGIAAYSVFVAIHAAVTAEDYGPPVFWVAIGIFFLLAATALWAARRIYRTRFSRPSD